MRRDGELESFSRQSASTADELRAEEEEGGDFVLEKSRMVQYNVTLLLLPPAEPSKFDDEIEDGKLDVEYTRGWWGGDKLVLRLRRKRPLHDSFSPNLFDTLTRKSSILIQSAVVDIWLTKALFICKVNEGDEEKRSVLSHHAMGNEVSSLKLLSYLKVLNNIGPMNWWPADGIQCIPGSQWRYLTKVFLGGALMHKQRQFSMHKRSRVIP